MEQEIETLRATLELVRAVNDMNRREIEYLRKVRDKQLSIIADMAVSAYGGLN